MRAQLEPRAVGVQSDRRPALPSLSWPHALAMHLNLHVTLTLALLLPLLSHLLSLCRCTWVRPSWPSLS